MISTIFDSGTSFDLMSQDWMNHYLKDTHVDESNLKRQNFARRLRLGKTLYVSEIEMMFLVVLKTLMN